MKVKKFLLIFIYGVLSVLPVYTFGCNDLGVMDVSNLTELKSALVGGGSYRLTADIESDEMLVIEKGKEVAIDLNGKKIVCSNDGASIYNKGNLTLSNGWVYSINVEAQSRMAIKNEGSVVGTDMVLGSKNSRGNAIRNYGTATFTNTTFDCCDNYINSTGYAYAIANSDGTMTVNNCFYSGGANGVFALDGGSIVVNGGAYVLNNVKSYYMFYFDEGEITVNSGTFNRYNTERAMAYFEKGNPDSLTINGGLFYYNGTVWQKSTAE